MKKLYIFLLLLLSIFVLVGCFGSSTKELSYYKQLWKDTFYNYQTSVTEIPKKGVFDFEFNVMVAGNTSGIKDFANFNFEESFSSLGIKIFGDHDLEDLNNPSLNASIKVYLNKRTFGLGDLDVNLHIYGSGDIDYTLNNIDEKVLKILQIKQEDIDSLALIFKENKGKKITTNSQANLIKDIFDTIQAKGKDTPLYQNSKEQEQKIISSFLDNEVVEVTSGTEKEDSISNAVFKFNGDNCIKFLNEVASIIGENKDFSADKEFFKSFVISGDLDIQNKDIVNSNINVEIPLSSVNQKSGETNYDLLNLQNQFKMPNPEKFNVSLKTLIFAKSSPDNKLQIELKGMIK